MFTSIRCYILTLILPTVQGFVALVPTVVLFVADHVVINTFLVSAQILSVSTCRVGLVTSYFIRVISTIILAITSKEKEI